jgi:hypothetical protein
MTLFKSFVLLTTHILNGWRLTVTRNLADLANDVEAFILSLPLNLMAARNVALHIIQDLIAVTPVDTGWAISNWQISASPVAFVRPAYFPGEKGSTATANRSAAYAAAVQALSIIPDGVPIYIGNAAPHIRRLNEGHSAQAPVGFIERAVMIGQLASGAGAVII